MSTIPHMESHTGSHRLPFIALLVVGTILVLGLMHLTSQPFDDKSPRYDITLRDGFAR